MVEELPLLDECRLLLTLLLRLLATLLKLSPVSTWKRSMDSDRETHRLLKAAVKPPSELIEWRSGMIWPWKNTSSAAHIWGSVKTEPINDLKSKSSSVLIGCAAAAAASSSCFCSFVG